MLLISVAVVLYFSGASAGEAFVRLFNSALRFDSTLITSPGIVIGILSDLFVRSLAIISPLLAMTVLLTIITAYLTGGIGFSVKAFLPKASKLNPISGLGRMFGARSLIELTKSLAKLLLISSTIIGIVYFVNDQLFFLNLLPAKSAIHTGLNLLLWGVLPVTLTLLLIAAIDLPYQIISFKNKLKMTRKELRDEFKETEGRPEVRARIRERQRQVAMNQMMLAISDADVIVTNPSHFAVALSYEPGGSKAPVVLAKGTDFIAAAIRNKANDSMVPILKHRILPGRSTLRLTSNRKSRCRSIGLWLKSSLTSISSPSYAETAPDRKNLRSSCRTPCCLMKAAIWFNQLARDEKIPATF